MYKHKLLIIIFNEIQLNFFYIIELLLDIT